MTDNPLLNLSNFSLSSSSTSSLDIPPNLPEEVDETYLDVLTFYETRFWLTATLPNNEEVKNRFSLSQRVFDNYYDRLVEPLKNRLGLELKPRSTFNLDTGAVKISGPEADLDPLFVMATSIICDTADKRTTAAKLKQLGMTTKQWQGQIKLPAQRAYFEKRLAESFDNVELSAKLSLSKNVEAGDLQSIKYYHEYTGKYRPQNDTTLNLVFLMGRMMEILSKFLSPEQLSLVADEIDNVLEVKETKELDYDHSTS